MSKNPIVNTGLLENYFVWYLTSSDLKRREKVLRMSSKKNSGWENRNCLFRTTFPVSLPHDRENCFFIKTCAAVLYNHLLHHLSLPPPQLANYQEETENKINKIQLIFCQRSKQINYFGTGKKFFMLSILFDPSMPKKHHELQNHLLCIHIRALENNITTRKNC